MLKRELKRILRPIRPFLGMSSTLAFRWGVDSARLLGALPQPSSASNKQERFVIINLTPHLGDTILQMPMIEALRKAHPHARIECAVEERAAPLLRMMPSIDHVYALKLGSIPPVTFWLAAKRTLGIVHRYWEIMRGSTPTLCVMPRWGDDLFRSKMLAYLTGASRRIGFAFDTGNEKQPVWRYRDVLLTDSVSGGINMHESEKFCLLLLETGLIPASEAKDISTSVIPSLRQIASTMDWPALAERIGVDIAVPFAVIAPGASHPRRIWPIESWAEVMEDLKAKGMQVVLLSGPQDAVLARQLHEYSGSWSRLIAGVTSLSESATLLSHAKLFLGNDSGPGHMAGALGVPSVILFVATKDADPNGVAVPERIRPIGPHVTICRPGKCLQPCILSCDAPEAHCIKTISPQEIIQMAASAIERAEGIEATIGLSEGSR